MYLSSTQRNGTGVGIRNPTNSVDAGVFASSGTFMSGLIAGTGSFTGSILASTTIELGNVSDTTLSRLGIGILGVEGVAVPTVSSADTFTNKRITSRVSVTGSATGITPNIDNFDSYMVTGLATGITFGAPAGTPTDAQKLLFRIKDAGVSKSISWDSAYRVVGVTLPTATTASKVVYIGCIYNSAETKYDVVMVSQEA